jgi:hypothetical protein
MRLNVHGAREDLQASILFQMSLPSIQIHVDNPRIPMVYMYQRKALCGQR